jgi:DNA-binding NarL/FixJ family response regulator
VLVLIFLVIVTGGIVDLILDQPTTLFSGHVLFEVGMVLVSLGAATYLARGWFQAQRTASRLEETVELREAERDAWRTRAGRTLAGFGQAMDGQFNDWRLTPAERETALMLLKGYSHKRIGKETTRSERTVRQHSVAVYRKSGLAGRAELAGFFLGDITLEADS